MEKEIAVLNPVKELTIGGEQIAVRELRWAEALEFLKKLSGHVGALIKVGADGSVRTSLDLANLAALITGTDDLASHLATKSTGKDAAWFGALSVTDALTVLDTALELNLNDALLKKVGALGRRLSAVAPGATAKVASQPSTTT